MAGRKRRRKRKPTMAAILGVNIPKESHPDREGQFARIWKIFNQNRTVPPYHRDENGNTNYVFFSARAWHFDFAWPDYRVGVEIQGGTFSTREMGHHTGVGIDKDNAKANHAQLLGWCVLKYSSKVLDEQPGFVVDQVVALLAKRKGIARANRDAGNSGS